MPEFGADDTPLLPCEDACHAISGVRVARASFPMLRYSNGNRTERDFCEMPSRCASVVTAEYAICRLGMQFQARSTTMSHSFFTHHHYYHFMLNADITQRHSIVKPIEILSLDPWFGAEHLSSSVSVLNVHRYAFSAASIRLCLGRSIRSRQ